MAAAIPEMMLAVALWTTAWAVLGAPDGDEEACALNGEVQHGRCVCDEGWGGPDCAQGEAIGIRSHVRKAHAIRRRLPILRGICHQWDPNPY